MKYEMYCDVSYYHLWAVRPIGDRNFESPNLKHFNTEKEAEEYKRVKEEK